MPGTRPLDESGSDALLQVRRFLMALADREATLASVELSADATYRVPGSSSVAGTFTGRQEIVAYFQRIFGFASGSEALQWVDWMVGINLVSVLVDTHLQRELSEFRGQLLFVFSRSPSGGIAAIRLFLEDQARFDRFFAQVDC